MDDKVSRIAQQLEREHFVELEASGRHVHLTQEAADVLFGHGLTAKAPLSQPGQFVCHERVALQGPKGTIERVAVLGPCRRLNQVEISLTDAVALGISVPVRLSGNTEGAPQLTVIGEQGQLSCPAIAAMRHIHMTPDDAEKHRLRDGDSIRLRAVTDRPLVFEDVRVRVSRDFATYVHLDYDEANACHFKKGDLGMILGG